MTADPFDTPREPGGAARDTEGDIKNGQYWLPDPVTGRERYFTRVTTFAKSISDTFTLNAWSSRMAVKGIALRPDLYALASATPIENREQLNKIVKQAKDAAAARAPANFGTALHAFTEQLDRGELVEPYRSVPPNLRPDLLAYVQCLEDAGLKPIPELIERRVCCPELDLVGTFDRIMECTRELVIPFPSGYTVTLEPGARVVVDLKTGRTLEYGVNEIAIQLAIYAHGQYIWDSAARRWDSDRDPLIRLASARAALVIHAPVGTGRAELVGVDIAEGWKAAQLCRDVRAWRSNRTLSAPVSVSEPPAPTRDVTWEERIAACTSEGELRALWFDHIDRTPLTIERKGELAELVQARLTSINAG